MKITKLETFIVNVPFKRKDMGSGRGGTTEVIVKLATDDGLVGWGESAGQLSNAAAIEALVQHTAPLVLGRDPWDKEAIAGDFFRRGTLHRWTHMAHFAFAGIDHALWDLCGKSCGQPVHRLLGGALRGEVDHCLGVYPGSAEEIEQRCRDGLERGYGTFYMGCGRDRAMEERMLEIARRVAGPSVKIRVDANERWTVNQAVRTLTDWDARFDIDFCEAPVPHDLPDGMAEVRRRVPCAVAANECLVSETDVLRLLRGRCADVYCFASYWVGTLRRFLTLSHLIALEGLQVTKHSYGELGICAAASQHAALCVPNLVDGNQQSAADLADDILVEPTPTASGPKWPRSDRPGLGVAVDEAKLRRCHEAYLRDGQFRLPEYRAPRG